MASRPPASPSTWPALHGVRAVLRITWSGHGWEEWTVSQPIAGKLAKLTLRASSFGATHGYGYGSNAAWSARASMAQIAAFDHTRLTHTYHLWKTDAGRPYLDQGRMSGSARLL
jgi:hypothetical protein